MKSSKRKIIVITASALISISLLTYYMVFIFGFYAESDKVVAPYTGSANIEIYQEYPEWEIGANKYDQPIFIDPNKAFELAQEKYADAINLIYESFRDEYNLGKFSKNNYQLYKMLGWQLPTDDEEIRLLGVRLTQFLDIYENSFKRWIYVPEIGWERICP